MMRLLVPLLFGALHYIAVADDVVLRPLVSTTARKLPQVGLTFIQGAGIKPETYTTLATEIQNALRDQFQLYVGIPEFLGDIAEPLVLDSGINKMFKKLQIAGLSEGSPMIMAGHSLGGAMVQLWTDKNTDKVRAQVLLGSFLTRTFKKDYVFSYAVPTITVGAELDGLARVTRIAEAFYTQILDPTQDEKTGSENFPVTVIRGATHMQFAEGEPPALVFNRDLVPEISYDEAHKLIAADVATFIRSQLTTTDTEARNTLAARLQETRQFITPILDALHIEGYHNFRRPCLCKEDTCKEDANCTAACPWTNLVSQKTMGAGLEGVTIHNVDSFHDVWETQPKVHLPVIHNSCEIPSGCTLETTTITQGVYHTGEDLEVWKIHFDVKEFDTGFLPITAAELRTKMSSRQNIYTHAGLKNQDFKTLDGNHDRCTEINQQSWDYALTNADKHTASRFSEHGQPYKIVPDIDVCAAGPCWIWKELQYTKTQSGDAVEIAAPQFSTDINYLIPAAAGYHYCKVLSPARAMEWIYVDGLREKFSLRTAKK